MALSTTLFPHLLLSLFLVLVMVRSQGDVTSFHIDSFSPNSPILTYGGDAFVPSGSSYLSVAGADSSGQPKYSSNGFVLYSNPVNFWQPEGRQASFETTITYIVSRFKNSTISLLNNMVFIIEPVNSNNPGGVAGGNLRISDAVSSGSSIFAGEFDDGKLKTGSLAIWLGLFATDQVVTVRISYAARSKKLTAVLTSGLESYEESIVYDWETPLPEQVQVGLVAFTRRDRGAFYNVFSWDFTSSLVWVDDGTNNKQNVIQSYA